MLKNLINIIASPQAAFSSLKEKRSALVPLIIVAFMVALTQMLYFTNVDPDYLIDQLVEQVSSITSIVPEDQLREMYEQNNPSQQGISTAISAAIAIPFMAALYAAFLLLISKFTSDDIGFKRWYCLVVWASIPAVFSSIAAIVVIIMSADGMIALNQLKPFSLNSLIFQTSGAFRSLLNAIDLTQLWTMVLLVLGYQNWTEKTLLKSALIVLMPYIIIYGIWTLIIIL